MLEDAERVRILDAIIPGGFDPASGAGWKTNPAGTAWRYRNPQGPSGIVKVRVRQRGTTPGRLRFVVTGQHGSYALSAASMPLKGTMITTSSSASRDRWTWSAARSRSAA